MRKIPCLCNVYCQVCVHTWSEGHTNNPLIVCPAAGASVQKGKFLDSPLHAAAEKDCTAVVKLLLDFGADINARNSECQRPVEVAPPSSLTEGFLLFYEGKGAIYRVPFISLFNVPKPSLCIVFFAATPRLLSRLCRQCIRNCVGRDRLHLLNHLPLPTRLRRFLLYQWHSIVLTKELLFSWVEQMLIK